jgi:predicted dehydrogenase
MEAKKLMPRTGPVRLVQGWWINHQASAPEKPLTGKLDWAQWLGASPKREVDAHRFFNWYYYWDYSGGLMVGQAAHIIDLMLWYMDAGAPTKVTAIGTRPNLERVEVSETTSIGMEFARENFIATFTVGYKGMRYSSFLDQLSQFHGAQARLDVGREHYALYPEDPKAVDLKASVEDRKPGSFGSAARAHIRNFLECIRSRQEPNAPVDSAQKTNIALCMAMESLRTGQKVG